MGDVEASNPLPMLMILCGLPYSGKSAVSAGIAGLLENTVPVEIDQINLERGLGVDGASIPLGEWPMTYNVAYERVEQALASGSNVVFDATNHSRAQRDILRALARRTGAESVVIHVDVPEEDARRRWMDDQPAGTGVADGHDTFQRVVDRFDPPMPDERVILYLPGMAVEDLVSGLKQVFSR